MTAVDLIWHLVRTEDNVVRFVLQNRRPPVWTEGGYADKLGLPPVAASTDELLATLDPAALDRTVTVKPLGEMAVGRALAQVCVAHGMMHFGEIELARTLVGAPAVYGG